VVADHGMVTLDNDPVTLSNFADLSNFHTDGSLLYAKSDADAEKAYEEFRAHPDSRFTAYRRANTPVELHFDANPRDGDPVIVPNGPFTIRALSSSEHGDTHKIHGGHGFNPRTMPQMKAIFFAAGPDIKAGVQLQPFENVNLYPFMAKMLGLNPPVVDGKLNVLAPALKKRRAKP
jgi:hypothetical protein